MHDPLPQGLSSGVDNFLRCVSHSLSRGRGCVVGGGVLHIGDAVPDRPKLGVQPVHGTSSGGLVIFELVPPRHFCTGKTVSSDTVAWMLVTT